MAMRAACSGLLWILTTSLAHGTMTDTVGNGGVGGFLGDYFGFSGSHFHLPCRNDEVMVGVYGRQGSWINKIGVRCVDVDAQGRWVGNPRSGRSAGGNGDILTADIEATDCPRNTAVRGFEGNFGSYVNEVRFECAPLASAEHIQGNATDAIGPFGNKGGIGSEDFLPRRCNANRAATGIYGRAGDYVDSMGLKCAHEKIWQPDYHYFPKNTANNESKWMNDPSGLVYKNGVYHLYYQAVNSKDFFRPDKVHWDHATSTDLLTWQDAQRVFSPVPGQFGERDGSPFTGSAVVVDRNNLPVLEQVPGNDARCIVAFVTRSVPPGPLVPRQRQNVAASCNGGESFSADKHALSSPTPNLHFRDPKVFRFEDPARPADAGWIMVLAAGDAIELYRATSLDGPWAMVDRIRVFAGDDFFVETADLMRLPIKNVTGGSSWVLTFAKGVIPWGVNNAMGGFMTQEVHSQSFYLTGDFNGRAFNADGAPGGNQRANFRHFSVARRFDSGPDFYASQSWHVDGTTSEDFSQRTVIGAWLNNWRYALFSPVYTWQGQLSIPRELSLQRFPQGDLLIQQPVSEVQLLRGQNPQRIGQRSISDSGFSLDMGTDKSYELVLDVDVRTANRFSVDINEGSHRGSITLVWRRTGGSSGRLSYDRRQSFPIAAAPSGFVTREADFSAVVPLAGNRLKLRVLVDRNSVETFAANGEHTLSALFYPHPDNRSVRFRADGATARLVAATVYDLDRRFISPNRARIARETLSVVQQRRRVNTAPKVVLEKAETKVVPKVEQQTQPKVEAKVEPKVTPKVAPKSTSQRKPQTQPKPVAAGKSTTAQNHARLRNVVDGYLKRRRQVALWASKPGPVYKQTSKGWQVDVSVRAGRSLNRMRYLVDGRWRITRAMKVAPPRK